MQWSTTVPSLFLLGFKSVPWYHQYAISTICTRKFSTSLEFIIKSRWRGRGCISYWPGRKRERRGTERTVQSMVRDIEYQFHVLFVHVWDDLVVRMYANLLVHPHSTNTSQHVDRSCNLCRAFRLLPQAGIS